ncbi:hypothetical protein KDH_80110 [Dictyobacter sp. S3.2.2.5]|uniref:Helix-turn-helix domain-containing protein n=1 Tax=Dictyobacter halimunensis TaxID=3026934 RepID=A0ABQ6G507_9CHLR|nr:hypothetical protein KDH_80110 [Dictyobacter sp. S3.2.2.5]
MQSTQLQKPTYISAVDAAKLIGISTRTIHRWIEKGKVQARHHGPNQLLILLADAEALAHEGPAVATPFSLLEDHTSRLEELQTQVNELLEANAQLRAQVTAQDERIEQLERVVHREYEAQSILHKLIALSPNALEGRDDTTFHKQRSEVGHMVRNLSVLEKRGLPPGSLTLSTFCQCHSGPDGIVHPSTIKGMVEAADRKEELITIYQRPTASTNLHEWWLSPLQQQKMIRFWQEQGKPFTPCPACPHPMGATETGVDMLA